MCTMHACVHGSSQACCAGVVSPEMLLVLSTQTLHLDACQQASITFHCFMLWHKHAAVHTVSACGLLRQASCLVW